MNSMTRSGSNVKPRLNVRGQAGSRTASSASSQDSAALQSSDVKDNHARSREVYYSTPQGHVTGSQHAQYSAYESRQQYSTGRVFSSRTPVVTPPSSDVSVHPLSDDETVRFIAEAWHEVEREITRGHKEGIGGPDWYREKDMSMRNNLSDFVPFDLEGWHAKRLNRF